MKNSENLRVGSSLPETSSVPSVNISRVKEEICPVKFEILDRLSVKLLLSQDDILDENQNDKTGANATRVRPFNLCDVALYSKILRPR